MEDNTKQVLDKGYVRLVDHMGSDLSVVNAARASFAKESTEFSAADGKLLSFLAREGHYSPFRHAFMTFEFKAPLLVARQHWKYVVGSDHTMDSWNEGSRRYITAATEFYSPNLNEWRSAPDNKRQGSGGPLGAWDGALLSSALLQHQERSEELYEWAMAMGVAPEQARLFLAAYGLYVNYRWSCSLQSVCLFLTQRLDEGAQSEISDYAKAVYGLIQPLFPVTVNSFVGERDS